MSDHGEGAGAGPGAGDGRLKHAAALFGAGAWIVFLLLVCNVLGILFVPRAVARLVRRLMQADPLLAPATPRELTRMPLGATVPATVWLGLATFINVSAWAGPMDPASGGPELLATAGVFLVLGLVVSPLAFMPFAAASHTRGTVTGAPHSYRVAIALGPIRLLAGTLAANACLVVGVLVASVGRATGSKWPPLLGFLLLAGMVPVSFTIVRGLYLRGLTRFTEGDPFASDEDGSGPRLTDLPRRVRAVAWSLAPASLGLAVALVAAAMTPTPLRDAGRPDSRKCAVDGSHSLQLPSAQVTATSQGIRIEAPDGGGAGFVPAGFEADGRLPLHLRQRGDGSYEVRACTLRRAAFTIVDGQGVRLDDGIARRVLGRLGTLGGGALFIAFALFSALIGIVGRRLTEARYLAAPRLSPSERPDERIGSDAGLRKALVGRLRIEGPLAVEDRRARFEGPAVLEADGGQLRVQLPPSIELASHEAAERIEDGVQASLVSKFEEPLGGPSFRQGAVPWPDDGELIVGDVDDAAKRLLSRAERQASVLGVLLVLAMCVAAGTVFYAV
jgi:hypothetical protein